MANNTDLVDAIDEAIECIEDNTYHNGAEFRTYEMDEQQRELVRVSLIRARDALRWIPVSEKPVITEEYPQFQVYMPRVRHEPFRLAQYVQSDKKYPWSVNGMSRIQATKEITHYRAVPNTPEEK